MSAPGAPRTVLVAGGTGFLGSAITRRLHDREGWRPVVLSRDPESVPARFPGRTVEGRGGDVTRPESLPPAVAGVDVVIQSVQFPGYPVEDPARGHTFRKVDAQGTANVAFAARDAGVRRLVYLSAVGADTGSPRPWYRAKGIAEVAVRDAGLPYTIVRPSWVVGPEDRSLNLFARIVRWVPGVYPQLGDGRQRLNPLWVEDLAGVVVRSLETPAAGDATFELGGPRVYTMDEIVRVVMRIIGREKPIVHVPLGLARIGAAVAELLPGRLLSRQALEFVVQEGIADLERAREIFPDLELTPLPAALAGYMGSAPA